MLAHAGPVLQEKVGSLYRRRPVGAGFRAVSAKTARSRGRGGACPFHQRARCSAATGRSGRSAAAAPARSGSRATSAPASRSRSRSSRARARRRRARSARRRRPHGSPRALPARLRARPRRRATSTSPTSTSPARRSARRCAPGELDDADAVEAAAQILDGLAHAHARGIVHRDVKPSNVLLAEGEGISVRLLDFGLAQLAEAETLTAVGDVPGTLAYISPERLCTASRRARRPTSGRSASLLWEALAGWHPFWTARCSRRRSGSRRARRRSRTARPDLPKPLCALVDRTLALDPAARPPAAHARPRAARRASPSALRRRKTPNDGPRAARVPLRARRAGRRGAVRGLDGRRRCRSTRRSRAARSRSSPAALDASCAPRLGLAFALAVPDPPARQRLVGLALVYAVVAGAWLALSWREPRQGLFLALGPLLAPARARASCRWPRRRSATRSGARCQVAAAVLLAARRRRPAARAAARSPARRRRTASASPAATDAVGGGRRRSLRALQAPPGARCSRRSSSPRPPSRSRTSRERGLLVDRRPRRRPDRRHRSCRSPAVAARSARSLAAWATCTVLAPQGPGLEFRRGA